MILDLNILFRLHQVKCIKNDHKSNLSFSLADITSCFLYYSLCFFNIHYIP